MTALRGVLLDAGSLGLADLQWRPLKDCFSDLAVYDFSEPGEVQARIAEADVVLTNKTVLDARQLQQAPQLKQIIVLATGTNNIDLDAARAAGICVCNNRDYSTLSLVEHTLMLMLSLARRLPAYLKQVDNGGWQSSRQFCLLDPSIQDLNGATLGIIGLGASGRGLARVAIALGMHVIALQSHRVQEDEDIKRLPLEELLSCSDVISIHCPLTSETRGLIGRNQLQKMKSNALLINTARGGIIVEEDLVEALDKQWIAGAAVDVLTTEPPTDGNPLLNCKHPNLIVTPHNAWGSIRSRQQLMDQTVKIARAFQQGEVLNCVND